MKLVIGAAAMVVIAAGATAASYENDVRAAARIKLAHTAECRVLPATEVAACLDRANAAFQKALALADARRRNTAAAWAEAQRKIDAIDARQERPR